MLRETAAQAGNDVRKWLEITRNTREAGRTDEANALLKAAVERFPEDASVWHDLARQAEVRQDWRDAERSWWKFTTLAPTIWWGVTHVAQTVRRQGRTADADTLLAGAREKFPNEAGVFIEHARLADGCQDWPEAGARWAVVAERFPEVRDALIGQARALRAQGHVAAARHALTQAVAHFPALAQPPAELARLEEAQSNWSAAERWWRIAIAAEPGFWQAHSALAAALRQQGAFEAASDILSSAITRFPDEPELLVCHARLADAAGDLAGSAQRWDAVCERYPHLPAGPLGSAQAARLQGEWDKASNTLRAATVRFSRNIDIALESGKLAQTLGLTDDAARRFRHAISIEPGNPFPYIHLARLYVSVADIPTAEQVLTEGVEKAGAGLHLLLDLACLSERKNDWNEAARRFRLCLERFPDETSAITGLAGALNHQGLLTEAEVLLGNAIERFPARVELAIAGLRLSDAGGAIRDQAYLERARLLQAKFPDNHDVCRSMADALLVNHLDIEAETFLRASIGRFSCEPALSHLLAIALVRQEKWHPALAAFADHVARYPPNPRLLNDYANALITVQKWNDAKTVIRQANNLFPADVSFDISLLDILIAQNELAEATSLWRTLDARPGGTPLLRRDLFERRTLLLGLGTDPVASIRNAPAVVVPAIGDDIGIEDIVTSFESMGGTGLGCEFGLFQRHFGAEPLGLLRWTEMRPEQLLAALDAGFEGVGTPEQTILRSPEGGRHLEYGASDRRFGMMMHTFVRADQVPADRMFVQLCRRLTYLRSKFIDDLHGGDKIFVYKNAHRNLSETEIKQLHKAVRAYGRSTLLYVRLQDESARFAHVESPQPGLLVGHIDQFSISPDGAQISLPAKSWAAVARNAYCLWRQMRASADNW
ncbi:tetratricopeptide repeat protein [Rhodopila sp.]|uniref:tetratricopeptide repeat protein n=1 Tax=Rhodopila sp. TaxID=2480087 RepID=UPI003D136A10